MSGPRQIPQHRIVILDYIQVLREYGYGMLECCTNQGIARRDSVLTSVNAV